MPARAGTSQRRRALALAPVALLAGAWVSADAGPRLGPTPVAAAPAVAASLAATTTPTPTPPQKPASVSRPVEAVGTPTLVRDIAVADVGSPSDIPTVALAAYQRAASVLGAAGPDCRIAWELVAAIGRVESDHGRHDGSRLTRRGVATPDILGPRLDGSHDTARLRDSDAGLLDGDDVFDRAVGPMQFIPSTWSVVGVDADGDGERNPQDVDDAALAAAVYLCSGGEDLASEAGRRAAVLRYNHSRAYVDLVLRIMAAYERSATADVAFAIDAVVSPGFDLTPTTSTEPAGGVAPRRGAERDPHWMPDPGPAPEPREPRGPRSPETPDDPTPGSTPTPSPTPSPTPGPTPGPTPTPTPTPGPAPTPTEPTEPTAPTEPTDPPEPTDPTVPTEPGTDDAALACADLGHVDDPALTDDSFDVCLAAYPSAVEACTADGLMDDPARSDDDFDLCVTSQLSAPADPAPSPTSATSPTPAG